MSVCNEEHFIQDAETVSRLYLASHYSAVTETSIMAVPNNALQAVQVSLESAGNEEHFTLDGEIIFLPYLASHFNGLIETSQPVLTTHALPARKTVVSAGHE
jgi:hypothetical protein